MAMVWYQELAQMKEELAARRGPRPRDDGIAEFPQYIEKLARCGTVTKPILKDACARLRQCSPQVERSVENVSLKREQNQSQDVENR